MKKKLLAILLTCALACTFAFTACGGGNDTSNGSNDGDKTEQSTPTEKPDTADKTEQTTPNQKPDNTTPDEPDTSTPENPDTPTQYTVTFQPNGGTFTNGESLTV